MGSLSFIGHSTFELELGGTVILFDPFFSQAMMGGARKVQPAKKEQDIKQCDLILVTHEHDDHCDKQAIESIAERTGAMVVAPRPALARLNIPDRLKIDVRAGDKFELKGVEIEVVQALHPQSAYPVGYIVRKGGVSVYHAGDTYEFRGMMDVSCDVALLPVGGSRTMDELEASKAIWEMKCKTVVPMHYDTHERIKRDDLKSWAAKQTKARVVLLKPGEGISI